MAGRSAARAGLMVTWVLLALTGCGSTAHSAKPTMSPSEQAQAFATLAHSACRESHPAAAADDPIVDNCVPRYTRYLQKDFSGLRHATQFVDFQNECIAIYAATDDPINEKQVGDCVQSGFLQHPEWEKK